MRYYKDSYLIVGCEDKMVRVYNTSTGDLIKVLVGHSARIKDVDMVTAPFTPEETSNKDMRAETKMVDVLTTVSSDGVLLFWNLEEVVKIIEDGEDINMKKSLGEFKTDMRVTCLAAQKGYWKNVGVDTVAAEESDDEEGIEMEATQDSDEKSDDLEDSDEDDE